MTEEPPQKATLTRAGTFLFAVGVCYAAAAIGSVFTGLSVDTWYAGLAKPPFTPPGWFIGAVWTVLYLLMGISLFLVLEKGRKRTEVREGVLLFGVQLALNVAWSFLFFGLQSPLAGLAGIVLLWIAILATILRFRVISRPAAFLLIPYILWVTIATGLNGAILLLNP